MRPRLLIFCTLLVAGLACRAAAEPDFPREAPLVVGTITVIRNNVFEEENGEKLHFPYSWANKIHVVTREHFIRDELLFKEGDPYDPDLVNESERLLRSRPIFRYVKITPREPMSGRVDIVVQTEDVWTTSIQLSYGTAGGKNFYDAGVLESNFLGEGRTVGAFVSQGIDRFTRGMSYDDVHLLGSRWHGFAGYGKDEKGREWEGTIERPFYSTRVRTSEGATALVSDDEDRLFQRGDEIANFQHALRFERVFGEFLTNQNMDRTRHLTFAYEHQSDHFADVQSLFPLTLHDRVISAPLVGFQYQDLEFRKLRGVLTFDRDEDINLGWDWSVEAGPSLDALGATRDGGLGRAHVAKVSNPLPPFVWFNRLDLTGRLDGGRLNNGVSRLRSEAYWLNWWKENTATLRGQWVASKRLDPESQFLLGGDTGLRAYPVREFGGTNTALVTLENRRVVLYDYLRLVTIGWAVFADAGEVWGPQQRFRFDQVRSDVGAGIRFAPSRSTDPGLIRIDVAYALNKNDLSTRFALNIGADIRFGERRERKFDQ